MTAVGGDHYARLGIERQADFQVVKKAYYRRAKECHPDRFGGDRDKEEEFKRLVAAFNVLSDPLARRRYDAKLETGDPFARSAKTDGREPPPEDQDSILDTHADDALEELIVGNTIPRDATLATLMLDLARTEQFCLFREAKTHYYTRQYARAAKPFADYLRHCPNNILGHYFLAQCHMRLTRWRKAERELRRAIKIGESRIPPLRLGRLHRELEKLGRKHGGLLNKIHRALATAGNDCPIDDPDAEMRRQVGRSINRLAKNCSPGDSSNRQPKNASNRLLPP